MNMRKKVFIIAEAGVNHNGDIDLAKKLIDAASESGVDAVKFQTWKTDKIVTKTSKMADYQKTNIGSDIGQYEMLKYLELSYREFSELKDYCDKKNITFLSTPDEEDSATFLNDLQSIFKIGSGELTNTPFLRHVASFNKQIILSTGMCYLHEVEHAVSVLLTAGMKLPDLTVLHATTDYPTKAEDVNLLSMFAIKEKYPSLNIGYSDHTLGFSVPIAAVALGASVLEKHFTLDRNMEGPDHKASLEPDELTEMVRMIRETELCMGSGVKTPTKIEISNREVVRKSLIAACSISVGEKIVESMLHVKRPGTGVSPVKWDEIINSISSRDYQAGEFIEL
jgi:N-acetylneuraminate synthase